MVEHHAQELSQLHVVVNEKDSPLRLLRDVRDIMSSADLPQQKLDALVKLIADGFHSEVCSLYLLRPGQILELYATTGLNISAIHFTRLNVGQGLVGHIAATGDVLNLAEAAQHEKFVYRAETGEELFHSFVGVPILASMHVIGVLVVQSSRARSYSEAQLEVLHTIAMVLAELATGQGLVDSYVMDEQRGLAFSSYPVSGQKLAAGLAKAPAVLHHPHVALTRLVSDNPLVEEARLEEALMEVRSGLDSLIASLGAGQDSADILETYRMFTYDRGWITSITQAIHSGLTAEAAVKKVLQDLRIKLQQVKHPHLRQRMEDMEDISARLLYHLAGVSSTSAFGQLPEQFILVSESLGPAELLEYGQERIKGVVLEHGSAASHITVIAKMLDIPVVANIPGATHTIQTGDMLVVDGDHGEVYIRPSDEVEQQIEAHLERKASAARSYAMLRNVPTVTKDGVEIALHLNVGLQMDAAVIAADDIAGIGLYRTELPFLTSRSFPTIAQQAEHYSDILDKAGDKPVIFRTFDIGGDKQVPSVRIPAEDNPALGWRATRIGLDRPLLLRQQLRALLSAAGKRPLSIMFPMIATASEFMAARSLLMREYQLRYSKGLDTPKDLRVGTMIEVPSLVFELPLLLSQVDFLSIGSNDLLQYMFAADRTNQAVSKRYDPLRPSIFALFNQLARHSEASGVELGFCGEMATRPIDALFLLACGMRKLSIPPSCIGAVKAAIVTVHLGELQDFILDSCQREHHCLRNQLQAYLRDKGVML